MNKMTVEDLIEKFETLLSPEDILKKFKDVNPDFNRHKYLEYREKKWLGFEYGLKDLRVPSWIYREATTKEIYDIIYEHISSIFDKLVKRIEEENDWTFPFWVEGTKWGGYTEYDVWVFVLFNRRIIELYGKLYSDADTVVWHINNMISMGKKVYDEYIEKLKHLLDALSDVFDDISGMLDDERRISKMIYDTWEKVKKTLADEKFWEEKLR